MMFSLLVYVCAMMLRCRDPQSGAAFEPFVLCIPNLNCLAETLSWKLIACNSTEQSLNIFSTFCSCFNVDIGYICGT